MPGPTLHDDGHSVTLDLHGTSVDEALRLTRALLQEAVRRGRHTVKLIHGASTSNPLYRNRTIKHELDAILSSGDLASVVTNRWQSESFVLVGLTTSTTKSDPARIRLSDVMP